MILVPLTLSRSSHGSLTVARKLARETNARLVLLHVVQFRAARQQLRIRQARLTAELYQNAEMQLNQLARSTNNQADVDIVVSVGNPTEKIVETARRLAADLIVLSTHGCRGWSKWLHRNTALHVTREAPCPVLLLSPGKQATTIDLTIVHQDTSITHPMNLAPHESPKSFRSLYQTLFAGLATRP
jgi:nucleotide-binding universal stress UspA family protein